MAGHAVLSPVSLPTANRYEDGEYVTLQFNQKGGTQRAPCMRDRCVGACLLLRANKNTSLLSLTRTRQ